MKRAGLSVLALVTVSAAAAAQEGAPTGPPPNPCEQDAVYSQFDFWVGDWNVYGPDGGLAGVNRIEKSADGCYLTEHWSSAGAFDGYSLNYYDRAQAAWRQVWVNPGLQIDYTGGLNEDGAMVLEGHAMSMRTDNRPGFRGTWTPQDDGSVIQLFEIQDNETGAWNEWFRGHYVPTQGDDNADAAAFRARLAEQG